MFNHPSFKAVVAAATVALSLATPTMSAFARTHVNAAAPAVTAQLSAPQIFVRGSSTLFNPDGIVITKRFVFVVWQNASDHLPGPSTIVKYDHRGNALGSTTLEGRCDGLRLNPATNLLWASVNNDGLNGHPKRQPYLATIDPRTLSKKLYAFPAVSPHGGGYDDIAFIGGQAFLSAASATLNAAGINDKPIAYRADLTVDGKVHITPILYGNSVVWDVNAVKYDRGNFSDPDSLAVDASNDLVVVGDNDQEVLVIQYPGSATKQNAVRYGYGTQFDDVAWTSGNSGTLWVADTTQNSVYTVQAKFPSGTVFSETGAGNPISSFIGTVSGTTITPLLTQRDGVFGPTSLEFVPASGPTDSI